MNRPGMPQTPRESPHQTIRLLASGIADAETDRPGPVAMWVRTPADSGAGSDWSAIRSACPFRGPLRILGIGDPENPDAPPADSTIDLTGSALIPGLVNAHTHLDLTAIGTRPHDPDTGFVGWVEMVRRERPAEPADITAAVRLGIEKSLAGGVVAVGDILGAPLGSPCTTGLDALLDSPLSGVGFVEFFGIGSRTDAAIQRVESLAAELAGMPTGRIRPGFQPHAPNTVSISLYRRAVELAADLGLPVCTHLAETPEERRFIADADGPQRELLERLGIWHDDELAHIGRGRHPVGHLADVLERSPMLLAHVNDAGPDEIAALVRTGASVAYCPRASAYFGAPDRLGPHRYREMLAAGVNVCLGTDSMINLDTPDRISPLDDARLLFRRDGADARVLLDMLTRGGARALGLDPDAFVLRPGAAPAGIVAVPITDQQARPTGSVAGAVLGSRSAPRLLCIGTESR